MTDCPNGEVRDLLPDLLHERLGADERTMVQAHLAACVSCRAELALLGGLRGAMRATPGVDVGAIVGALPTYRAPAAGGWSRWRAAAAIAAIAVGGASMAYATREVGETAAVRTPAEADVAVASSPGTSAVTAPVQVADVRRIGAPAATGRSPRELPLQEGLADLSEGDLSALLAEIETLDGLPAEEGEGTTLVPASALPATALPAGAGGGS